MSILCKIFVTHMCIVYTMNNCLDIERQKFYQNVKRVIKEDRLNDE
jgi:transposase